MSHRIFSSLFLLVALFSFSPLVAEAEEAVICTRLTSYLAIDDSANNVNEVIAIQTFLRSQGLFNAKSTGYFGTLTETAVKAFQSANKLEPVGYVGPLTRARIEAISCTGTESGGGTTTGIGTQGTTGGTTTGGGSQTTTGTSVGGTTVDFRASINERKDWYDAPTSNPLVITADQMLYMTWTATNATSCTPSAPIADIQTPVVAQYFNGNTWIQFAPGSMPLRGGPSHYPTIGQTITYTITCTGPNGGIATDSVTIRNAKPAVSKVDLKINGSDSNFTLKVGDPVNLSWEIIGGAECVLFSRGGEGGKGANVNLSSYLGKEFSSLPSTLSKTSSLTIRSGEAGYPVPGVHFYTLSCPVGSGTGGTEIANPLGKTYSRGDEIVVTNPAKSTALLSASTDGLAYSSFNPNKGEQALSVSSGQRVFIRAGVASVNQSCLLASVLGSGSAAKVGYEYLSGKLVYDFTINPQTRTQYDLVCDETPAGSSGYASAGGDSLTVVIGAGNTTPAVPTNPTTPTNPVVPPSTGTTGTSGSMCVIITSPILEGSSGGEVTALQNFLRTQGFFTANSTGFFGPITASAVSAFQSANGLEAVGSVGPLTRAKIQSISCGTTSSVISSPTPTNTGSTATNGGIVVTIKAKPPTATIGLNSTLSWSAPNALSCTASGSWSGPRGPVGEQIIGPLYSAGTYGLTCRNETSSGSGSVFVSVQAGDTPTTGTVTTGTSGTNTGATGTTGGTVGGSSAFAVGDTVAAIGSVSIKSIANVTAINIGTVPSGTRGTVWGGPVMVNGENWWNISFANVAVGWVGEKSLTKVASGGLTTNFVVPGSNVAIPKTTPPYLATCPAFDYDVSMSIEANGQIPNPNVLYILPTGWARNTNVVPNTVTVPSMGTFPTFPTMPTQINYNYSIATPVGCGGFLFSDNTVRDAKGVLLRDYRAEGLPPISIGGGKTSNDVFRQTNGAPLIINPASICELAGVPAGTLCTNFLK